jgi:hypothetical protein
MLRDYPQTRDSKNAKNSNNRNWRLDNNRAKLNPAAGQSDEWGPPQSNGSGRGGPKLKRPDPLRAGILIVSSLSMFRHEFLRRQITETGMRTYRVVMPAPALDHHLGLCARAEPFQAQALVAKLAVEALANPILPGFARIDQRRLDALLDDPL